MDIKKTWFTSDQHILHENIVHMLGEGRPFRDMKHMLAAIRDNWWATVKPDDDIYLLGDIAMGDIEKSIKFFEWLPGNKKFIPGNHDKLFSGNSKTYQQRYLPLYESVGFEILPENIKLNFPTSYGEQTVVLSHFPYSELFYKLENKKDKYASVRPVEEGLPLLHGHTHSRERFNENLKQFHVGVDANNFTPVQSSEIVEWLEKLHNIGLI